MRNRVERQLSVGTCSSLAARPTIAAALVTLLLLSTPLVRLPYGPLDWTAHSQPYVTPAPGTTTVVLNAAADATIDQEVPAENLGGADAIWIGQVQAQQPAARRGLLRFDLSEVLADATIESATLELYLASAAGRSETEIAVFGVLDGWAENEVTWNSAPALAPRLTTTVVGTENRYYAWNVTELAQGWHAGTFGNNGLLLRDTDESSAVLRGFFSREADVNAPRMVVTYASASPVPPLPPTPTATATQPATLTPTVVLTATPTVTQPATPTPTVVLTATPTATPSALPSPTATLEPGACDADDPASACAATLTIQAYVDHRCDKAFILGVDRPISGATVVVTFPDGKRRTATTNTRGFATFVQLAVPAGSLLNLSIEYPLQGPGNIAVVSCPGSPETVTLTAADFGFGQFKFVSFRAQPATFGIP
ncbi:MAG: DNRLRE domain-containing protein [Anaerolineae bacterium]